MSRSILHKRKLIEGEEIQPLLQLLTSIAEQRLWGTLTLTLQDGKIKQLSLESTLPVRCLEK